MAARCCEARSDSCCCIACGDNPCCPSALPLPPSPPLCAPAANADVPGPDELVLAMPSCYEWQVTCMSIISHEAPDSHRRDRSTAMC